MENYQLPIDVLTYSMYSKYVLMDEYFKSTNISKYTNVCIYIDLSLIKNVMYKYSSDNPTKADIAARILNMAAHYRHYFRSRFKSNVYMYLIGTTNRDRGEGDNISRILSFLSLLVPYFPNMYCVIKNNCTIPVSIMSLIRQAGEGYYNVIISRDPMSYQIPIYTEGCLIRPNISRDPIFVDKNNVLQEWKRKYYPRCKVIDEDIQRINPKLLPVIISFSGCNDMKLPCILNFPKTIDTLLTKYMGNDGYYMLDSHINPDDLSLPLKINNPDIADVVMERLLSVDLIYLLNNYSTNPECWDTSWAISKPGHIDTIMVIIDRFFNGYIDIISLYE